MCGFGRGISCRAIERWAVKGSVGFIPALQGGAFSLILRKIEMTARPVRVVLDEE